MKNTILAVLLFVVAAVFFLLSRVPVQFALSYLPANLPLQLSGASGTVWNGRAQQLVVNGTVLGRVEWQVHPLSLLGARLNTEFKLDGNGVLAKGNATIGSDQSIELTDTVIDADIASLPLPPDATAMVTPAGRINATVRQLQLEGQKLAFIDSDVLWNPAQIVAPAEYQLGEVSLKLNGENGQLNGVIKSEKGQIDTNGTIEVAPNGMAKSNIRIAPNASTPQDIRDLLPMIGKPDRNGVVTLKEQIKLPGWAS